MANVFLSYQRRDQDLARRIADALRGEGLTVWWDDDLNPRESWDRTIEREIAASGAVLVLWTRNSVESDWVRIEANYARNCAPSKLVQARFDHSGIPIAFSMTQYVDIDYDLPAASASWPRLVQWLGSDNPYSASAPASPSLSPPSQAGPEPATALQAPGRPSTLIMWQVLAGCAILALIGLAFLLFARGPSYDADHAADKNAAAIVPTAATPRAAAVADETRPPEPRRHLAAKQRATGNIPDAGNDDTATPDVPDVPDLPDVAAITAAAHSQAAAAISQALAQKARAQRSIHGAKAQ